MKKLLPILLLVPLVAGSSPLSFWDWAEEQELDILTIARCAQTPDECIIKKYGKHYHIYAPFILDGVSKHGKIIIYGTRKSDRQRSRTAKGA